MRIAKWAETFEGPESRRPKSRMEWYSHPVDLMSRGTIELTSMGADGLIALAVFNLLCQWTAGQSLENRGKLTHSNGDPLGSDYLSRAINVSKANIEKSLGILEQIGWLEQTRSNLINVDQVCSLHNRTEQDRTQQDTTEQNKTKQNDLSFDQFWIAYPKGRKGSKKLARTAFDKALKEITAEVLIAKAKEYASSDVGQGKYVKGPASWLNQGCWDDDPAAWQETKKPKPGDKTQEFLDMLNNGAENGNVNEARSKQIRIGNQCDGGELPDRN